jgi:hypothetical protein
VALEQRLRAEALTSGIPLNRLRKESAFNRLLAGLSHAAPDVWALKGGLALIARVGAQVRGTKGADTNWRATRQDLEDVLFEIEDLDLQDWFRFSIGDARPLLGEGEAGALRYSVTVNLAGRVFEQLSLDVNVINPDDPRPIELVKAQRNPFDFIGEPLLEIPMVTPAQQLAEKLHAYTRWYSDEPSSRAKDLFDMLVIADQVQLPTCAALTPAVRQTLQIRATDWPPKLAAPPTHWAGPWAGFTADYPLPWHDLDSAFLALRQFWEPILTATAATSPTTWDRDRWEWQ